MDERYMNFLAAGSRFYDRPRSEPAAGSRFMVPFGLDWSSWQEHRSSAWTSLHPGTRLPAQAWKIHVSATPNNAQRLLTTVATYCWTHRLSFKFIPDVRELVARNGKQADRGSSGKFITIYPQDEDELRTALLDLDALVGGEEGPYVLSDLRWKAGPLSVRYGAFLNMTMLDEAGEEVPAMLDESGTAVPDLREAAFLPPSWVEMPGFLREQLESLGSDSGADFGWEFEKALHFSNGGGVYLARHITDGRQAVLKEARPHAGLTPDGRDAVARLRAEEAALRRMASDPAVPEVLDCFEVEGHLFLAMEYVEGPTLAEATVLRSPLIRADSEVGDYLAYRDWVIGVDEQLRGALARIHAAGLVVGDIHPRNALLTGDEGNERVVLIDLEMAREIGSQAGQLIGAPGFTAPHGVDGARADRYSLACLTLSLLMPLTPLIPLDPGKAAELIDEARRVFALPDDFVERLASELAAPTTDEAPNTLVRRAVETRREWNVFSEDGLAALQVLIGRGIRHAADFARSDRCFPGDIAQFAEPGFGLAHGAAGVMLALDAASIDIDEEALDWLDAAVRENGADRRLGLYDGLAGAGFALRRFGEDDAADEVFGRVMDGTRARLRGANGGLVPLSSGVYGGLAGIGLYLLDEGGGEAVELAQLLGAALRRRHREHTLTAGLPEARDHGLMWGASGVAIFASRLFEKTGDGTMLGLALDCAQSDLDRCVRAPDGSLQFDEGFRLLPYLASGSAGVGLALAHLLPYTADPERYLDALDGIQRAAHAPFTIGSGLFSGRAGLIHLLVALGRLGLSTSESEVALSGHVEELKLHAMSFETGIAFPGDGLLRLSCDLATGSAGVLSALQAYSAAAFGGRHDDAGALLPLVLPTSGAFLARI